MSIVEIADNDICRRCQCKCNDASTKSYRNGVLVDLHCESCIEFKRIEEYRKEGVLSTRLIMNAALWGFERRTYPERGATLEDWRWELYKRKSAPPLCIPEEKWTDYRHRIDGALGYLPERGALYTDKHITLGQLVQESKASAVSAERMFGLFDGYGNPIPQPRCYVAVNESVERITKVLKTVYEPRCWFGGLQKFVRPEPVKGHSAEVEGLKMLSYCMAGRAVQTLSIGDDSITLITAEDEDEDEARMGIQGIDATEERAIEMLTRATALWESGVLKLKRDGEVSIV